MSVWELYTQLSARNWRCRGFVRSFSQGCSEKIRKKDVVMTTGRWSSWSIQIPQFLMLWWPAMKAGSIAMSQRPRDRVPSGKHAGSPRPKKARQSKSTHKHLMIPFLTALAWSTCTVFSLDRQSTKNVEVLREFCQHSSNRVRGISTRTMHQSTTPSLSQTIWPRWASRQFLTLPMVQTLLPATFGYSLSSRKNLKEKNWGDERGCDGGHWHAHRRGLPWGLPEVVGTVQQVYCSRRRLVRRGLEFHVWTINKGAHTKTFWKLIGCTTYV